MTTPETHRAVETVWRIESAKLIACLARIVRDIGLAEDLAQDALVIALERWPESGIPNNPGAWLMATAKHRAIDRIRRNMMMERKHEELGYELEIRPEIAEAKLDAALDDEVGDDLLSLMFTACHPVLSTEARVALTLRLLGWSDDRGDRAGLSGARGDNRPAYRPGQADPHRGARAVRGPPAKVGRFDDARTEFERAATLTRNARERDLLLDRARSTHAGRWRCSLRKQ